MEVHDKNLQLLEGRYEQLARVVEICKTYGTANANKVILDVKHILLNAVRANNNPD